MLINYFQGISFGELSHFESLLAAVATNTTSSKVPMIGHLKRDVAINMIIDGVSTCIDLILLVLLVVSFVGNRSFIIFLPNKGNKSKINFVYACCAWFSKWLDSDRDDSEQVDTQNDNNMKGTKGKSNSKSKSTGHNRPRQSNKTKNSKALEKYRTRALLNWTLFLACIYIVFRIIAQILTISGSPYPIGPRRFIVRVANLIHMSCYVHYQVLLSMLIVVWMRISFLWYKGSLQTEKVLRIVVYVLISLITLFAACSVYSAVLVQMLGPEVVKNPKVYTAFYRGGALGFAASTIALTLVAVALGIRVVYMLHKSSVFNKKQGMASDDAVMSRQRSAMFKSACALFLLLIAVNIRTVGLALVFAKLPVYTWTILTRSTSDLFGIGAIIVLYWPFKIAKLWDPIINMRQYNTDTSEATELVEGGILEDAGMTAAEFKEMDGTSNMVIESGDIAPSKLLTNKAVVVDLTQIGATPMSPEPSDFSSPEDNTQQQDVQLTEEKKEEIQATETEEATTPQMQVQFEQEALDEQVIEV